MFIVNCGVTLVAAVKNLVLNRYLSTSCVVPCRNIGCVFSRVVSSVCNGENSIVDLGLN